MNIIKTAIPGVLIIEPKIFGDARGFFLETFQAERYAAGGVAGPFVQDNLSRSARGTLRGLHFQNPKPQGKLVTVLRGAVRDVAVDVRVGSPTFGRHVVVAETDAEALAIARRAYPRWRTNFFWLFNRQGAAPRVANLYPDTFDELMAAKTAIAG